MISTSRTHFNSRSREGSDAYRYRHSLPGGSVNSRSREGSDYNKEVEEDAKEQFQFTLP